jgi:ComF family protein
MELLEQIKEAALDLLFPRRCPLCGALINSNERICSKCARDVEFIRPPICRKCGRPSGTCSCRRTRYAFRRNVSPLVYTKAARRGIHRMKFRDAPSASVYFGKLMANVVRAEYIERGIDFDCVIGVPMHAEDYRRRGYNQADLLAKTVAEELGLRHSNRVLLKYRRNNRQHTLSYLERRENIKDVFRVARPDAVQDKTVLLCDDVTTSGSTLNECAETLLEAGAREVYCVTATVAVLAEMPAIKTAAFGDGY